MPVYLLATQIMKKSSDRTERGKGGSEMPQNFGVLLTDQPTHVETIPEYFTAMNCYCYYQNTINNTEHLSLTKIYSL